MTEAERDRAGELGSLNDLIVDAKRGLTAIPDVTATDDERRFIAWARYYHGGVVAFVEEYDQRTAALAQSQTVVAAARALVEQADEVEPAFPRDSPMEKLWDRLYALAREVHALDSDGGEQT